MIYTGTSGFSYDDWVGPYYPAGLPKRDWLAFYAREFNSLELNASYYAVPVARNMALMAAKTPDGFLFSVKAHQDMTHKREDNEAVFAAFVQGMAPLQEAGKMGCVLAQFPFSFHADPPNRDYLRVFRERLDGLPLVVEFRNREWLAPDTFDLLRQLGVGFCCVDEPRLPGLMPPVAEATSEVAYVRFHGRNAAKWWQHAQAWERYDYTYRREELEEWAPKIRSLAEQAGTVFLFANNHYQAQAVDTARQLKLLVGE
jgi:uncharacterized protein YecE (DUF72 family)